MAQTNVFGGLIRSGTLSGSFILGSVASATSASFATTASFASNAGATTKIFKYQESIFNKLAPDTGSEVWKEPFSILATGSQHNQLALRFGSQSFTTDVGANAYIISPTQTSGSPELFFTWTTRVPSGNVMWAVAYRIIGGYDTTALNTSSSYTVISASFAAPTTGFNRMTASFALTGITPSSEDSVQIRLFRIGSNKTNDSALDAVVTDVLYRINESF